MSAAVGSPALSQASAPTRASGRLGRVLSTLLLLVSTMLLIAVVVAGAGGLRIRVEQTGSMAPTLQPGDLVIVQGAAISSVRPGDVIGVRGPTGAVVVHRVTSIVGVDSGRSTLQVVTKGDANPTGETWSIPRGDQIALVRGSVPHVGALVDAVKGPWAALAVLLAGLALAAGTLHRIWRPAS